MDSETMPNSAAKRVIESYLQQVAPGYALLVDGPWGGGKTHIIKQITQCEIDLTRVYATLYDVDSPEAFDWALVRAMNPWSESGKASWTKRFKEFTSGVQVFGTSIDLNKVNLTEIALRALPDTLIFDDIERCQLKHEQLSGLINRFVEHQNKRVILIANSDMHRDKAAFVTTREKLIGQTITLRPELEAAMVAVWGKIPDGQGRQALQKRQQLITKTFEEAGHQNLRLLLRAMREAAAMLDAITPEMLEFGVAVDQLTATFLALHMAYHGGRLSKSDMLGRAKYRSVLSSKADNEKASIDALRTIQAAHPDCSIDSQINQILPVGLGYALIVDGHASTTNVVEGLLSTHQFSAPAEKPDWVRLWKWTDEPLDELEAIIQRLKVKIETLEITEPGEVLQLYAASRFVASQNGIGLSEIGVAGYFNKYIRLLAKHGKIPARIPGHYHSGRRYGYRDEGGTCSYEGYAFNINKSDRRIIDLMQKHQDDALAKEMPVYAVELMKEFSNDVSDFLDRFENTSSGANFSATPVLHYIDVNDLVNDFLAIFEKDRDEAQLFLILLGKRRSEHRKELQDEWRWIDQFREISIRKGQDHSQLLGAQLAQYFQWYMKTE